MNSLSLGKFYVELVVSPGIYPQKSKRRKWKWDKVVIGLYLDKKEKRSFTAFTPPSTLSRYLLKLDWAPKPTALLGIMDSRYHPIFLTFFTRKNNSGFRNWLKKVAKMTYNGISMYKFYNLKNIIIQQLVPSKSYHKSFNLLRNHRPKPN